MIDDISSSWVFSVDVILWGFVIGINVTASSGMLCYFM